MAALDDSAFVVCIVDDDPSIGSAIARLLTTVDIRCKTFSSAAAFLGSPEFQACAALILDLRMPGMSGLDLQAQLVTTGEGIPVIFVTAYADVPLTVRAMKRGALEVLTKPFDDQALIDAVHRAIAVGRDRRDKREHLRELQSHFETLTPRERQVLELVASGLMNREIAAMLGTTEKTIKVHRANVMDKMKAESFAALVRMADRLGIAVRVQSGTGPKA